ncbi:MAG: protein kinase [Planctomycetota bacterium]|nr:protein kinase [Planctomycetota bacterium]
MSASEPMTPERFAQIRRIFAEALGTASGDRPALIARLTAGDEALRREVERLLAAHERAAAGNGLEEAVGRVIGAEAVAIVGTRERGSSVYQPGDRLDRYLIVRELGEGGFGVVYLAEQVEPVKRQVAIKVIRPGMDRRAVIARFEQERQSLAMMNHPNVAKVLDGGVTQRERGGTPYFVMEYVRGEPITAFCAARRFNTRQRMELFVPVCEAVQHAHQMGVVHRDLKPSNILVEEVDGTARPKVIDFGIAKAIDATGEGRTIFTEQGALLGTPAYMSPEQASTTARGIDTRSDVYALGILLYELLGNTLPYDLTRRAMHEVVRIICEEEPTRLGQVDASLRGDIETIVGRALEKDPARRYQSADLLALDIRHYLSDQPITARPPSVWYQVSKFSRRNRALVWMSVSVLLVLVVAVIVTSVALARAVEAEDTAQDTLSFWQDVMSQAGRRSSDGIEFTIQDALMTASSQLEVANDVCSRSTAYRRHLIGKAWYALGDYAKAASLLESAVMMFEQSLGSNHSFTRTARWDLALTNWPLKQRAALPEMERALRELLDVTGSDDRGNWERMASLAALLGSSGQATEARAWINQLERARSAAGDPPSSRTAAQVEMARAQSSANVEESVHRWRKAVAILTSLLGPAHVETIDARQLLCFVLSYNGREPEAIVEYESLVPHARKAFADPHFALADMLKEYAGCLITVRRADDAERVAAEAIDMYRRLGSLAEPHRTLDLLNGLGAMHQALGNTGRVDEIREKIKQLKSAQP